MVEAGRLRPLLDEAASLGSVIAAAAQTSASQGLRFGEGLRAAAQKPSSMPTAAGCPSDLMPRWL